MIILTIRTDKPLAEIGLFDDTKELVYEKWEAHRQLAETIHQKIAEVLKANTKSWEDIEGLVCYKGPGSFTGLRIGLTIANSLAYGLGIPIISQSGKTWIKTGTSRLKNGDNEKVSTPKYGAPVKITLPRK